VTALMNLNIITNIYHHVSLLRCRSAYWQAALST